MAIAIVAACTGAAIAIVAPPLLRSRGILGSTSYSPAPFASDRAPELGSDETPIGSLRITVETGVRNGAGTDRPILAWLDNARSALTDAPETAFASGKTVSAVLRGPSVPRTLGDLRRASIVLALDLSRAAIDVSWYCERALVEVRLEGSEEYRTYLDRRDVGWLSQNELPRRSPAYALQ